MASLTTNPNKTRVIQTVPRLGRKTIRLGKVTAKTARAILGHVEALEAQKINGYPASDATQQWLKEIDAELHERVARAGLVERAERHTLDTWIERCIEQTSKTAVAGTITRLRQSQRTASAFFGEGVQLHKITRGRAEDYEAHVKASGLALATSRKRIGDLKQWLGKAVKHGLIERNPFDGIKTTVPPTEHHAYISDKVASDVMQQLPTASLRASFALSRWGGLRSFSEHARLKWSDVDWHQERITINGKGGVVRQCPLFPELVEPLHDLYEVTEPCCVEVFPGMKADSAYYRRQVERAVKQAKLKQWPRLFHNMRASRITDLIDRLGMDKIKTICFWMGNSPQEAIRSYMIERGREESFKMMSATGAAKCAAQTGEVREKYGKEKPANDHRRADSGENSDPYGVRSWLAGACTDNYLRAFTHRRAAISAAH